MNQKVDFTQFQTQDKKVEISEVSDVSEVSNQYLQIESEILNLEEQVKRKKQELQQANDKIVELMTQRGVKEIKTVEGDSVSFKPFYKGSISKDNQPEAFQWLEDNGHGDLIKNIVSVKFGKGDNSIAENLINELQQRQLYPDQKRKVEPMTLNALIGEQINKGNDIPMETFSVFVGNKVKIKKGK
jgi:hypothetical protein|tara:strand:+ start:2011 stop:2568 length:558 start_codon:yes stop_codon:yes gene_type:complete